MTAAAIDHLVIAAETLAEGVAWVEDRLGIACSGGGAHPAMGTHNRLIRLGDLYLEVIAIDPEAAPPTQPRWFGLDTFSGPPRLVTWVARVPDLDAALAAAPCPAQPLALTRGDLAWRFGVSPDGALCQAGAYPCLIEWQGDAHPVPRLAETPLRLFRLEVTLPDALALPVNDPRLVRHPGPPALSALIDTPQGLRHL